MEKEHRDEVGLLESQKLIQKAIRSRTWLHSEHEYLQ